MRKHIFVPSFTQVIFKSQDHGYADENEKYDSGQVLLRLLLTLLSYLEEMKKKRRRRKFVYTLWWLKDCKQGVEENFISDISNGGPGD